MGFNIDDQRSGIFARIFGYGAFAPQNPDPPDPPHTIEYKTTYDGNKPRTIGYFDENGSWVQVFDYRPYWEKMDTAEQRMEDFVSPDEWMANIGQEWYDPQGSDAWTGITDLQEQLEAGPDPYAQQNFALESAALAFGYVNEDGTADIEAYQAEMDRLRTAIGEGRGMTPEQRAQEERAIAIRMDRLEESATADINAILAGGGQSMKAITQHYELIDTIQLAEIAEMAALDQRDLERVQNLIYLEGEKLNAQQISAEQYWDQKQDMYAQLMNSYALQIDTGMRENEQWLSQYQADMQTTAMAVDAIIEGIYLEMGIEMHALGIADHYKEEHYSDYYMDLEQWELGMEQQALNQQDTANFLSFLAIVSGIALAPMTGGGSLIGSLASAAGLVG